MLLSNATVVIVGLGLMGGSLGRALVETGAVKRVNALVRRPDAARAALKRQAAHTAATDPGVVLPEADLVVFATPVRTIERQIVEMQQFFKPGATITDMGSVKVRVVAAMEELPAGIHAVGGHPMCGKETSGLAAADSNLFQGKTWVVVPLRNTSSTALSLLTQLVQAVGAKVVLMTPEDHDEHVACVSHLPYLLASTLVAVAEKVGHNQPSMWDLASSGFRDTSRVAAGDLTMMMDILDSNRENILSVLTYARQHLDTLIELLANRDEEGLRSILSDARKRRAGMFTGCAVADAGIVSHG